jgi:hypothetical protein
VAASALTGNVVTPVGRLMTMRSPIRNSTRATAVAVACIAVVSSLLASPVEALERGGGVRASDLPSVGQAARVYDYLEGGSRTVFDYPQIDIRRKKCLGYTTGPSPTSGKRAFYNLPGGYYPIDAGLADPEIFVFQFDSVGDARDVMIMQRRAIRRCEGTTSTPIDADTFRYRVTSREIAIRELGDGRVAHREFLRFEGEPRENFAIVWVRTGRYLIKAQAERNVEAPSVRNVARLAAISVRNIG